MESLSEDRRRAAQCSGGNVPDISAALHLTGPVILGLRGGSALPLQVKGHFRKLCTLPQQSHRSGRTLFWRWPPESGVGSLLVLELPPRFGIYKNISNQIEGPGKIPSSLPSLL